MGTAFIVVDDEKNITDIIAAALASKGHTVLAAGSSHEAKDILSREPVQAAIIDIILPDQGGLELAMELHTKYPQIQTVIMSGKVDTGRMPLLNLVGKFGIRKILPKPFSVEELFDAADTVLVL